MSTAVATATSFRLATATGSAEPTIRLRVRSPQGTANLVTLEALEDFQDVMDAHKAFAEPRNATAIPWSKVKRSLKL